MADISFVFAALPSFDPATDSPEKIADSILAFGERHSPEYRIGLVATLHGKMHGDLIQCLYHAGTAQYDAFMAGSHRGLMLWDVIQNGQGGCHD